LKVLQCVWVNCFTTSWTRIKRVSFSAGCLVHHRGCRLRWILYLYNRWLVSTTAEDCMVSFYILHTYLKNTLPERQYKWLSSKLCNFWQIWSLDPTGPVKLCKFRDPTRPNPNQPDPRVNPTRVQLCVNSLRRYERRQKCKNWGGLGVRAHPRPSETPPFDRAHMTYYLTVI